MTKEKVYPFSRFCGAYSKIYTLSDKNGNVFYVGCTVRNAEIRFKQHINEAKAGYLKSRKLKRIQELNYEVVMTIVDMFWITGYDHMDLVHRSQRKELEWINKYRELGYELTNGRIKKFTKEKQESKNHIGQTFQS
jgi:hypothetical protein